MVLPAEPKTKRITTNPNTNIESNEDRLSDLPDPILDLILSLLDTKQAFQTSILSKRWKNLPKHLSTLRLSRTSFHSFKSFMKSLSRILSLCDDSTSLHTLDFYNPQDFVDPDILKSMVNYAVLHNVQVLRISVSCDIQQLPLCLFSSQTLVCLNLHMTDRIDYTKTLFPSFLNLPALTTLTLKGFYFGSGKNGCLEPFSALNKLKTLNIQLCRVLYPEILSISNKTLVNLTIHGYYYPYNYAWMLSAPSLSTFAFTGSLSQKLCVSHPCSITHLYIDAKYICLVEEESAILFSWLLELPNIKSLTVSSNTLQALSFVPDLFKVKLTSLCNLESLQVETKPLTPRLHMILRSRESKKESVRIQLKKAKLIADRVVEFLLQNSPSAKINIIDNDV